MANGAQQVRLTGTLVMALGLLPGLAHAAEEPLVSPASRSAAPGETTQPGALPVEKDTASVAQPRARARRDNILDEVSGRFLVGGGGMGTDELNRELSAAGYDRFGSATAMAGASGRIIFDFGLALGLTGVVLGARQGDGPSTFESELGGGWGYLDAGFAVVNFEHFVVIPSVALGGYGLSLLVEDTRDVSFDEVLGQPARSSQIWRPGLLLGADLTVEGRIPLGREKAGRPFLSLGARGGYIHGFAIGSWVEGRRGSEVDDGPDADLRGGYAMLSVGAGFMAL